MQGQATYKNTAITQKDGIRQVINYTLAGIRTPYFVTPYDQELHDACCKRAIEKNYPMGTDRSVPSLLPFIPSGVIIAMTAYAHLEDQATRVFIALYTAFLVYVDDTYERDNTGSRVFIERFVRGQKQVEPVLDSLAGFLTEIADHYEPVAANIILTATLNLINASTLEFQTQNMQVSLYAKGYPHFTRAMSGSSETYALMAFPKHLPLESYIQCLPEAANFIGYTNDVLSFYKEEVAGETVNYISVLARSRGVSNMTAFQQLAEEVVQLNASVCKILGTTPEAYNAWQRFKDGYISFHTSFDRYRLAELMGQF